MAVGGIAALGVGVFAALATWPGAGRPLGAALAAAPAADAPPRLDGNALPAAQPRRAGEPPLPGDARPPAETPPALPLVNTDEELDEYLHQAESRIQDKQYAEAIDILQALIASGKRVFHRTGGDGRRFISLRAAATAALGRLPAEGLDLYRRLYDPQAGQLMREAGVWSPVVGAPDSLSFDNAQGVRSPNNRAPDPGLGASDPAALLRRVVEEFRHTRHGPAALDRLAALEFDRGDFLPAARGWQEAADDPSEGATAAPFAAVAVRTTTAANGAAVAPIGSRAAQAEPPVRAMRLTKAALAWRLAGDTERAAAALAALKRDFPTAEGPIAGRREGLAAFVERALAAPVPAPATRPSSGDAWPSLAGSPDGLAAGAACDAAMFPLWRQPQDAARREAMIRGLLNAPAATPGQSEGTRGRTVDLRMDLRDGHVRVSALWPGMPRALLTLAAVTHPIVVGDLVLCREFDEVMAYDATTGRPAWQTSGLPLTRAATGNVSFGYPFHQLAPLAGDIGRYTLTAGGGCVFAVHGFPSTSAHMARVFGGGQRDAKRPGDGSGLAAVSLAGQGKILWRVGLGDGDSEVVREGKFLTAPTYADGRLYAVVLYLHAYHAVCLDARTGATLWETAFGQEPSRFGEGGPWNSPMYAFLVTERGSPPAVADGAVFVTSNAGLVSALAADTGRPLWTYQYASIYADAAGAPGGRVARLFQGDTRQAGPLFPINPVLAARGRVLCLPADSDAVLALAAGDGSLLWKAPRQDQHDLTGLDADRVLLSGKDFLVLRAADGSTLKSLKDVGPILGRPAVAGGAIVASGRGEFVRVDLGDYAVRRHPVVDDEPCLGALVAAGGRLIAANAAGVCAYFNYADAWQRMGERLAGDAAPAAKVDLHLARGRFALLAGRLGQADDEFGAAARLAGALPDADATVAAAANARLWRYRLAVRQADAATADADVGRRLDEAAALAAGPQAEAEMLVRRVKYHERFGRATEAAAVAQALAEKSPDTRLRDVALGPDADPVDRPAEAAALRPGYAVAQQHLARLIGKHGPAVYAAFDAQARQTLDTAGPAGDVPALLAAQRRYPHSACAAELLLTAAETLTTQAATAIAPLKLSRLERADRILGEARAGAAGGPLTPRIRAASALIDERLYPQMAARLHAGLAKADGPDAAATVAFADFRGTLGELAARLSKTAAAAATTPAAPPADLDGSIEEVYRLRNARLVILRDPQRRALRIGSRVFLYGGGEVLCIDTQANDFARAVVWKAKLPSDEWRCAGYLTPDLRRLAVLDGSRLVALDPFTGAEVYRRDLAQMGVEGGWMDADAAGTRLVLGHYQGRLRCIDLERGEVAWQTPPMKDDNGAFVEIAGDTVLARNQNQREARLFDLRTGKALAGVASNRGRLDAALTADGLLVLVQDNVVGLCDPRRLAGGPLWQTTLPDRQLMLLGVGERYLAVAGQGNRTVAVLDMTDGGRTAWTLPRTTIGDRPSQPAGAVFDGDRMILLGGTSASGMSFDMIRRFRNILAPCVQAVDLTTGKPLWMTALTDNTRTYAMIEDPTLTDRHLSVIVRPNDQAQPATWVVLGRDKGEVVRSGGPAADDMAEVNPEFIPERYQLIGNPVLLNGRLLIEDHAGLLLLRSAL